MNTKLASFVQGLSDGLNKLAEPAPGVGAAIKSGLKKGIAGGAKGVGFVGRHALSAGLPFALMAGVPLYFGAKAVSEGFGRGVSEEADKELSYRR